VGLGLLSSSGIVSCVASGGGSSPPLLSPAPVEFLLEMRMFGEPKRKGSFYDMHLVGVAAVMMHVAVRHVMPSPAAVVRSCPSFSAGERGR